MRSRTWARKTGRLGPMSSRGMLAHRCDSACRLLTGLPLGYQPQCLEVHLCGPDFLEQRLVSEWVFPEPGSAWRLVCVTVTVFYWQNKNSPDAEGEGDLISLWEKGETIWKDLFLNFHTCEQCAMMNGYISSPPQTQYLYIVNDPAYSCQSQFISSPPTVDIVFNFVVLQFALKKKHTTAFNISIQFL